MVITVDMNEGLVALFLISLGMGMALATLFACLLTVMRDP